MASLLFPYLKWPSFFILTFFIPRLRLPDLPSNLSITLFVFLSLIKVLSVYMIFPYKDLQLLRPNRPELHPQFIIHPTIALFVRRNCTDHLIHTSTYKRGNKPSEGSDLYKVTEFFSTGRPNPVSVLRVKQWRRDSSIPQGANNLVKMSDIFN